VNERKIYVPLSQEDMEWLSRISDYEMRRSHEQASYFIRESIRAWRDQHPEREQSLVKELQDLTIDQQQEIGQLKRRLGEL